MEAGLPNITGDVSPVSGTYSQVTKGTNAFKATKPVSQNTYQGGSSPLPFNTITFNASDSNLIYGSSDTVTPLSLTTKLILKY